MAWGSVLALTFASFVPWEKVDRNVSWFCHCLFGLSLVWDYVNMRGAYPVLEARGGCEWGSWCSGVVLVSMEKNQAEHCDRVGGMK